MYFTTLARICALLSIRVFVLYKLFATGDAPRLNAVIVYTNNQITCVLSHTKPFLQWYFLLVATSPYLDFCMLVFSFFFISWFSFKTSSNFAQRTACAHFLSEYRVLACLVRSAACLRISCQALPDHVSLFFSPSQ